MIKITTGVAFLLSSMYGPATPANVATANQATTTPEAPVIASNDTRSVESYLQKEFADTPILVDVARCESGFSQFDKDGNVVRGRVNPGDVGVMQINEKYHAETAKKLGYDLMTLEGNVAYAKHLYQEQGLDPWKYSSKCWNNGVAIK